MRAFLVAVLTAAVISVVAMFVLGEVGQRQSDQAFSSTPSVRLPEHGTTRNLVGKDWPADKNQ